MLNRLRHLLVGMTRPLHSRLTYTIRRGLASGLKRRGGLGFLPRGGGLSAEERYLKGMESWLAGRTVFDVGGERGLFALFFARAVGSQGRLEVFEPNPVQAEEIRHNMTLNRFGHVTVHGSAVGKESGTAVLQFSEWRKGTGSLLRAPEDGGPTGSFEVPVASVDELVETGGLRRPNFMKIDVEGAEWLVLQGMQNLLREAPPRLFIEVHDYGPAGGSAARDLTALLLDCGYRITHVESGKTIESVEDGDLLVHGHCAAVPTTGDNAEK